jgi:hypothetical protein
VESQITRELRQLLEAPSAPSVSVFLPTLRGTLQAGLVRERLRALLEVAQARLLERGVAPEEAERILVRPRGLLRNDLFWRHPGEGLAVYASAERFLTLRLPLRPAEEVAVGERFRVRPLLGLLAGEDAVYILALSPRRVRLLVCGEGTASEVGLRPLPDDLLAGDAAAGDEEIVRYLRLVDSSLRDALPDRRAPLVLAGEPPLPALYRRANTHPGLAGQEIPGDACCADGEELYRRGRDILEPLLAERHEAAAVLYERHATPGRATSALAAILPAASAGRVATLLLARDAAAHGRYDPDVQSVEVHGDPQPGDDDLLDAAAFFTLRGGGEVVPLTRGNMPGGDAVAALLRDGADAER